MLMKPLYYSKPLRDPQELRGQFLYRAFNKTIELNVVRRQEGQDIEAIAFKEALDHLREEAVTLDD